MQLLQYSNCWTIETDRLVSTCHAGHAVLQASWHPLYPCLSCTYVTDTNTDLETQTQTRTRTHRCRRRGKSRHTQRDADTDAHTHSHRHRRRLRHRHSHSHSQRHRHKHRHIGDLACTHKECIFHAPVNAAYSRCKVMQAVTMQHLRHFAEHGTLQKW